MSKSSRTDDVSALLYMLPFIASALYAIYLGVAGGVPHLLSPTVYVDVTRDPEVFLVGTLGVTAGMLLDVTSVDVAKRAAKVAAVSDLLQVIALVSFILAVVCALYANGLSLSGAATDLLTGRFSLVFPLLLVGLSYLLVLPINTGVVTRPWFLGIVAMLLVPVSLHEIGKRNSMAGLWVSLILIGIGVYFFLRAYGANAPKPVPSPQ